MQSGQHRRTQRFRHDLVQRVDSVYVFRRNELMPRKHSRGCFLTKQDRSSKPDHFIAITLREVRYGAHERSVTPPQFLTHLPAGILAHDATALRSPTLFEGTDSA